MDETDDVKLAHQGKSSWVAYMSTQADMEDKGRLDSLKTSGTIER